MCGKTHFIKLEKKYPISLLRLRGTICQRVCIFVLYYFLVVNNNPKSNNHIIITNGK